MAKFTRSIDWKYTGKIDPVIIGKYTVLTKFFIQEIYI